MHGHFLFAQAHPLRQKIVSSFSWKRPGHCLNRFIFAFHVARYWLLEKSFLKWLWDDNLTLNYFEVKLNEQKRVRDLVSKYEPYGYRQDLRISNCKLGFSNNPHAMVFSCGLNLYSICTSTHTWAVNFECIYWNYEHVNARGRT